MRKLKIFSVFASIALIFGILFMQVNAGPAMTTATENIYTTVDPTCSANFSTFQLPTATKYDSYVSTYTNYFSSNDPYRYTWAYDGGYVLGNYFNYPYQPLNFSYLIQKSLANSLIKSGTIADSNFNPCRGQMAMIDPSDKLYGLPTSNPLMKSVHQGGYADFYFDKFASLPDLSVDMSIFNVNSNMPRKESTYMMVGGGNIGDAGYYMGPQIFKDGTLNFIFTRWAAPSEKSSIIFDLASDLNYKNFCRSSTSFDPNNSYLINFPCANLPLSESWNWIQKNYPSKWSDLNISIVDNARNQMSPVIRPGVKEIQFFINSPNLVRNYQNVYQGSTLLVNQILTISNEASAQTPLIECSSLLSKINLSNLIYNATNSEDLDCFRYVSAKFPESPAITIQKQFISNIKPISGHYTFNIKPSGGVVDTNGSIKGSWYRIEIVFPDQSQYVIGEMFFPAVLNKKTNISDLPLIQPSIGTFDEIFYAQNGVDFLHWSIDSVYSFGRTILPNRVKPIGDAELDASNRVHFKHGDLLPVDLSRFKTDPNGGSLLVTKMDTPILDINYKSSIKFDIYQGSNLIGNSSQNSVSVENILSDPTKVASVWLWNANASKWSYFNPSLSDHGRSYAANNGYDFLVTIPSGAGFWVMAFTPFTLQFSTTNLALQTFNYSPGWNLGAIMSNNGNYGLGELGIDLAALSFNYGINGASAIYVWDAIKQNWYFYSIKLSPDKLAAYNTAHGYLNWSDYPNKLQAYPGAPIIPVLEPGVGIWFNAL